MTDLRSEQRPPHSPENPLSKPFALDVAIKGRQYIFAGTLPQRPSDSFAWRIHIPTWQEMAPLVSPDFRRSSEFQNFETTGEIGMLEVDGLIETNRDILYLAKIRSNSEMLPLGTPYHESRGIGSFLLQQLLTLADAKGLFVEAYIQAEGRLSDYDMKKWFKKVGFSYDENGGGDFIRPPQTPDLTQPIATILE